MPRPSSDRRGAERSLHLLDVLDRVLDKGIVIDVRARMSVAAIDLIAMDARIVVSSLDTYLTWGEALTAVPWFASRDERR